MNETQQTCPKKRFRLSSLRFAYWLQAFKASPDIVTTEWPDADTMVVRHVVGGALHVWARRRPDGNGWDCTRCQYS